MMLSIERRGYILKRLEENNSVKVDVLAKDLDVSPMTIRRDLDKLEEEDLALRTHGGAILKSELRSEDLYETKITKNKEIKVKIAEVAFELINDGDTIILDAGTTTLELTRMLNKKKNLTIVTGDLLIASEIYQCNHDLFFVGGKVQRETGAVFDELASRFLESIIVDKAFMGTAAISNTWDLTTVTFEKATVKRKIIDSARQTILLADSSKFGKQCFVKIDSLRAINKFITDKKFTVDEMKRLKNWDIQLINVQGEEDE